MKKIIVFLPVLFVVCISCSSLSENLLLNADAEVSPFDSVPQNWQNISGHWVSAEGDSAHHDYAFAQHGSHYFFAGYGLLCTLQQDVDVSKYATSTDNNKQKFVLSGYEQTLEQGTLSDQGMLKAECLDASKNKILFKDSTDTLMSVSKWKAVADTLLAPASTRFVRIQLVAFRNVGGDNDGYFDNISLVALPAQNYFLLLLIIVLLIVFAGIFFYFKRKKATTISALKKIKS